MAYYTGQWISGAVYSSAAGAAAASATAAGTTLTTAQVTSMWATAQIAGGAAGGFAAGLVGSGGDLKAAVQGAFVGALFGAAGGVGEANSYARYAAHAGAGCVSSVANGGNCGQGAASAVFGKYTTNSISDWGGGGTSGVIARGVATMVAGGVGSVIAGDKFANGAETAAFGYLFNELSLGITKEQAGYEVRKTGLSYGDAVDHWANGGGMDVRVPLSSLDLSSVRTADFGKIGDEKVFNLSGNLVTHPSDQLVYGNVTLKLVARGVVQAGYDRYNFNMQRLTTQNAIEVVPRNVATFLGGVANSVAGTVRNPLSGPGRQFFIQLDGKAQIR